MVFFTSDICSEQLNFCLKPLLPDLNLTLKIYKQSFGSKQCCELISAVKLLMSHDLKNKEKCSPNQKMANMLFKIWGVRACIVSTLVELRTTP